MTLDGGDVRSIRLHAMRETFGEFLAHDAQGWGFSNGVREAFGDLLRAMRVLFGAEFSAHDVARGIQGFVGD